MPIYFKGQKIAELNGAINTTGVDPGKFYTKEEIDELLAKKLNKRQGVLESGTVQESSLNGCTLDQETMYMTPNGEIYLYETFAVSLTEEEIEEILK